MNDAERDRLCIEAMGILGKDVPLDELRIVYDELVKHRIRRTAAAIAYRYRMPGYTERGA